MEKLLLLDAYSQIFRSFYAIRELNNARGEPVNAAYVFARLLLKLEKSYPERSRIMLFDSGKVEFRLKLAPDYKANRPPMPDALKSQIPLIKKIAAAFGWKLFALPGFEADDLIGMIARKCGNSGKVQIVSSDKDLAQLVTENVTMLVPQNGNKGDFEERGIAEVTAKFGVAPELIVDYLALLGDSSDNINGVPGIGPKSAVELLTSCGSADKWLEDTELVASSRFFKKLDGNFDLLRRNRELVRLRTDMAEELDAELPGMLATAVPDWKAIAEICRDNQFNSILKDLPEDAVNEPEISATADDDEGLPLFDFIQKSEIKEADTASEDEKNSKKSFQQLELF